MKVIAFNGSPRRNGNTAKAIEIVFKELRQLKNSVEKQWIGVSRAERI